MNNNRVNVILYDGITGSTNLMSILSKVSGINVMRGYNPFGSGEDCNIENIVKIINTLNWENDKINCFKFRYSGHPYINGSLNYIIDNFDNFIILTRNNIFEHVLSELIKEKSCQPNAKITENVKDINPFKVDINKFIKEVNKKQEYKKNVLNTINNKNKRHMYIDYSILFQISSINSIYDFMGIGCDRRYDGDYKKINSNDRYRKLILNYNILEEIYENIEYKSIS